MTSVHLERLKVLTEKLTNFKSDFETFFDTSPDLLSIFTTDGHYISVNPMWEKTLGYSLEEMRGRRFGTTMKVVDEAGEPVKNPILGMKDGDTVSSVATVTGRKGEITAFWSASRVGDKIYSTGRLIT